MAAAAAQVKQLAWDEQARELMAPSAAASPWAMVEGFSNALHDAHLWQIDQGGARVLLAVRGVQMEHGRLLDVVGMRSLGERFRAADLGPVVESIARSCYEGVDLLTMCTRHPHLVRACERQGWTAVAQIVNKPLRLAS
jgi:hypothetical protein